MQVNLPKLDLGFLVRNLKSGKNWLAVATAFVGWQFLGADKTEVWEYLKIATLVTIGGIAVEDGLKKLGEAKNAPKA